MTHYLRLASLLAALLLTAAPARLRAQTAAYSPAQTERLAKLAELYGHIKFFHPYLGYKSINWDSAFAAAAPRVALAGTDAEAAAALRGLLTVLGDPATTVRLAGPEATAPASAADSLRVFWGADSTLVLQTNAYAGADNYEAAVARVGRFAEWLPRARAVLLDLRSPRPLTDEQTGGFAYALSYTRLPRALTTRPCREPAMRRRGHSGFAPEDGSSSGGYYSYFYTRPGEVIQPTKTARARPTAILVNENTVLPASFYALQGQPQVRLFGAGPLSDAALASTATFAFSETIKVVLRTGELVNLDGSLGVRGIEALPPTVRPESAAAYALAQVRGPRPGPVIASSGPPAAGPGAAGPPAYAPGTYPALGYRMLAGAKMWAVIHYFHAYRELWPTSWDAALRPALAELAAAPDATAYALAVAHLYRHIQDGHGTINSQAIRDYVGAGGALADLKFIDNQPVISKFYGDSLRVKGLRVGDVLTAVNGEPVAARVARLAAIQPASNEWTRRRYIAYRLLRAPVGAPINLTLLGADNRPKTVRLIAQPGSRLVPPPDPRPAFRVLPGNLGYVDLDRLDSEDTDKMFEALKNTKAIIFDMRGYPHGTAWTIAPRLSRRPQPPAANFFRYTPTTPSLSDENGLVTEKMFFTQTLPPNSGKPGKPVYGGKTVMLIDERTQSQAEHTGLFFEAANGTEFIGSPTAGANGDVTSFAIPGGITLAFSGHDVRHADGRQLQQVGLQPKILVRPTLAGIRAGRDEVLERAVRYLTTGK